MKNCENCGSEHEGTYGSGRFCSLKCARGFSTKGKRKEINKKVSEKLKGKDFVSFEKRSETMKIRWKNTDKTDLSERFSKESKERWKDDSYRAKMLSTLRKSQPKRTEIIRQLVKEGRWHGWVNNPHRISYAEKYFVDYFNSLGLKYLREVKIGKYFADFLFGGDLVLEIDGKQHEIEENVKRDEKKDNFLRNSGYKVFRIKWKNVNFEENRKFVHSQTQEFLKLFNAHVAERSKATVCKTVQPSVRI